MAYEPEYDEYADEAADMPMEAEPAYEEDPYAYFEPAPRRPRLPVLAGVVIIALIAGGLIFLTVRGNGSGGAWTASARNGATNTATSFVEELSTYSYTNLNGPGSPWAEALKNATPKFQSDFNKTSSTLNSTLQAYKARATAKVSAVGISSLTSSRAVVLVFVDQTVTNSAQKSSSATQPLAVQLVLLHQHGRWLVDNLEIPQ